MKVTLLTLKDKAAKAKRESKYIEFKEKFDIDENQDWCAIIKDIIAISNSGGGILLIGVKNNGEISDFDCSKVLAIDPVTVTDKIYKYTNVNFQEFEIEAVYKEEKMLASFLIFESKIPIPFCKPGSYAIADGKQKTAFSQGSIYFRHGAKSETCTVEDLRDVVERNLDEIKKSWLGNIRKVVTAPSDATVAILPPNVIVSTNQSATPIRITNDSNAPSFKLEDPNSTHPYRGKELIKHVLSEADYKLTNHLLQLIRNEFNIDETRPDFFYKPKFASPLYSVEFAKWIIALFNSDNQIFENLRQKYSKQI